MTLSTFQVHRELGQVGNAWESDIWFVMTNSPYVNLFPFETHLLLVLKVFRIHQASLPGPDYFDEGKMLAGCLNFAESHFAGSYDFYIWPYSDSSY